MVGRNSSLYLFIGQDSQSKDIKFKQIKRDFLHKEIEAFNLDILYARELNLRALQEKLLLLPVKAKRRIIFIKEAQRLKEEIKEFILKFIKSFKAPIILILDIDHQDTKDEFIRQFVRAAQVYRFNEPPRIDTFTLNRQIELRRPDYALRILSRLLENGEKPERIMGGLRYVWERDVSHPLEIKKRLKLLLNCDIDIKSGRLRPEFALEKLVVSLCTLISPQRYK